MRALSFSRSERYLLSLGGEEDGMVALWDLHTGSYLASAPASRDSAGITHAVSSNRMPLQSRKKKSNYI